MLVFRKTSFRLKRLLFNKRVAGEFKRYQMVPPFRICIPEGAAYRRVIIVFPSQIAGSAQGYVSISEGGMREVTR